MPLEPMYTPQGWPGTPQKLQETRTDSPPASEAVQAADTCLSDLPPLKAGEKESCSLEPPVVAPGDVALATPQAPRPQVAELRTGTGTCRAGPLAQ